MRFRGHFGRTGVGAIAAVGLVLTGCGGGDDGASSTSAPAAQTTSEVSETTDAPETTDASETTDAPETTDASETTDAPAADLRTLSFGVAGLSAEQTPAWVALAAGYFDEVGLPVDLTVDGANLATNVASGRTDLGGSGIGAALAITNQGRDTSIVYWWAGRGAAGFLVGPTEAGGPEDCETVATYPEGTSAFGWAQRYNAELGLDWSIVVSPDVPTQTAGLRSGQYDCAVSSITPYISSIEDGSIRILIDPRDPADLPPSLTDFLVVEAAVFGLTDNLEDKRSEVTAFLQGLNRAVELMDNSSAEEIADLLLTSPETSDDWSALDRDTLIRSLEESSQSIVPNNGEIPEDIWAEEQLDFYVSAGLPFIDPSDEQWSYGQRVDMSFLEAAS